MSIMEDDKNNSLDSLSDLGKVIKEHSSMAASFIENQDFENALESLGQTRELLTSLQDQGGTIDYSFWVETFHNSALCFQK
jgi:hypothetical protein